jgi:hypothetical protein
VGTKFSTRVEELGPTSKENQVVKNLIQILVIVNSTMKN